MKVIAVEKISAGETGLVEVISGGDMYNEDGLAFDEILNITGYDPTGTGSAGTHTGVGSL